MEAMRNKQIRERKRGRIRGGLIGNVDFNGVLLLGAAAVGALLAAAFAVRRDRSNRRRRGVTEREPLDGKDQKGNQENFCKRLCSVEVPEIVEDEADEGGSVEQLIVYSSDNFDASHEFSQVIVRESDAGLLEEEDGEGAERSSSKEIDLVGGVEGEVACFRDSNAEICSFPVSTCSNVGICCSVVENQLRKNAKEELVACVKEEWSILCNNNKEEDDKRENVNKIDDVENFEEHNTSPNLSREELQQFENKALQNLEMVIAKEESNFGKGVKNDSGKHPEMMIMEEDGNINGSDIVKGFVNSDVFCDEGNSEGGSYINKVLDGPGGLGEQAVVIAVSESEKCSCQDPDMVMLEENAHLMAHDNAVVHIEEEVKEHDNELASDDEGVDGLLDEVQRATNPHVEPNEYTESCTCNRPALIMEIKETHLEENSDIYDVIQESVIGSLDIQNEKAEESLLHESQENIRSSKIEEYHRENKEPDSGESQEIMESSLEQDNQMDNEESPMIQLQGIELATREEKASSEDKLPLSLEPNVMILEPIQNSEKALKVVECHMEASSHSFIDSQELGISPIKEEGSDDKTISVQSDKHEAMQNLEADKNKKADVLVEEIEYHKTLPLAKINEMPDYIQSCVGGILKESQASHIKEQEDLPSARLSFDVIKEVIKLVSVNQKKRQHQVEKHFEKNDLKKSKQLRTAAGKERITEFMFTGYPKGNLFMVITLAAAFVVLAIIYHEGFHHRSHHLGKNYHRLYQIIFPFYNITF